MRKKNRTGVLVGGAILLIIVIWLFATYNSLVKKDEKIKKEWAEVQSTYQRRLDLIPNIVSVVKGVSEFEQTTLEKIATARADAMRGSSNAQLSGENYQQQGRLQDTLAAASNRVIAIIEKYPVLKGTAAYAGLQTQLVGTERRIRIARVDFNTAIADYNKQVRRFPTNIAARLLGFRPKEGFQAVAGADKAVEITF